MKSYTGILLIALAVIGLIILFTNRPDNYYNDEKSVPTETSRVVEVVPTMTIPPTVGVDDSSTKQLPQVPSLALTGSYCALPQETQMLNLVNQFRASYGRPPLKMSRMLATAARAKSTDMAVRSYFAHTSPSGVTASQLRKNYGYTFNTFSGENIAAGNATANATFLQWRDSPAHRDNMLSTNYKVIGIGYAYGATSPYKHYWTQEFGGYDAGSTDVVSSCTSVPLNTPVAVPTTVFAFPTPKPTIAGVSPTNTPTSRTIRR